MSINPQLLSTKKDSELIRKTVLLNITKMLKERGNLHNDQIAIYADKFKMATDDNTYIIDLNKSIDSESKSSDFNKNYKGNKVVIRLIPQKVIGIHKSPVIKEFLEKYRYNHKFLIFDSISDKAKNSILEKYFNTEIFPESFFMDNLIDNIDSPKYELLPDELVPEMLATYNVKKNQLMKMLTSDKATRYFNFKRGQIVKIIRPSEQTIESVAYRIIAKGST